MEILLNGQRCGELITEENGLYICYRAVCRPCGGPVRLFAVGECGELRLGVMQPENGCLVLNRRISCRESAAAGRLLRGEVRPFLPQECGWHFLAETEPLFCGRELQMRIRKIKDCMACGGNEQWFLAAPFETGKPFPLVELFCFARMRRIGQREYAVFCFDASGQPVFF